MVERTDAKLLDFGVWGTIFVLVPAGGKNILSRGYDSHGNQINHIRLVRSTATVHTNEQYWILYQLIIKC